MENNLPAELVNLEPELQELCHEFLERVKGKTINETMPILAEFKTRLPKDRIFTAKEKNAIIETALQNLPENERNKYKSFFKMFKLI